MKIVHTADWHVGKTIKGKSRATEYREVLEEMKEFLRREKVDLLLVAGDLFDSTAPSAESEDIVYNFFHDISRMDLAAVVIAGNHDSGLRFEAISNLMALAGVTMRGFFSSEDRCRHIVKIRNGGKVQHVQLVLVPFVPERSFVRSEDLISQEKGKLGGIYSREMGNLLRKLCADRPPKSANIIVSHLLMHGSKPGGGEKHLYLGDNYAVHPDEIPENIDYVAIGHIHLYQAIPAASPIYYSGSPLQIDFGEKETPKGFLYLEIEPGKKCEPVFVELKSGKKLIEIKGTLEEISSLAERDPNLKNAHLKVTLKADSRHDIGVAYQVKKLLPEAVEIRREYAESSVPKPLPPVTEEWLPSLYREYHEKQYQRPAQAETVEEFNRLYRKSMEQKKK